MKRPIVFCLVIVIVIVTLTFCTQETYILSDFKQLKAMTTKFYQKGMVNPSNARFMYFQNSLYWIDYKQDEFLFSKDINQITNNIINKHNIAKGKGPDEFLMVLFPEKYKEYLSFIDSYKGALFFFKKDTLFKELQLTKFTPASVQGILKMNDNRYLYSGYLENSRFVLIDSAQKILFEYKKFPENIDNKDCQLIEKNMACQNLFTSFNNFFANIIYDSGIIEFFKLHNDSIIKINDAVYSEYKFSIVNQNGATRVSNSKSNTGFIDICPDKQYVYALYSSVSWEENSKKAYVGDYILIYDWEGEAFGAIKLDTLLRGFSIVPNKNKFWGWGDDSDGIYFSEISIDK